VSRSASTVADLVQSRKPISPTVSPAGIRATKIAFVTKLIDDMRSIDNNLKRVLVHSIEADDVMRGLGVTSKLNADREFIMDLHRTGRERADRWLKAHLTRVGVESTVDIREKYL
jgi:NTE family protein